MKKAALSIALLAASLGCNGGDPGSDPKTANPIMAGRPLMPGDQAKQKGDQKRYILLVYLKMTTISVPTGTVSTSEKLWSYLDEECVTALRSANLGRNGLRVGVVDQQGWKDVVKVLEELTGRQLKATTMLSQPGEPFNIALKQQQPVQTVFVFSDDRTLEGRDYPEGDNLLTLSCTLNEDDPSKIMITAMPQIRTAAYRPRFIEGAGLPRMAAMPDYYSFDAATFQVTLPSKNVLIVGPGSESRRSSSIGHEFLVRNNKGVEYETVLVLIPEVFATPLR
ncbi:MAG TPA: hypothetical protein VM098_09675 [Phycisphaerae bacterium]|nr:hypothetical protein [Phycisphaerae bacterium]